MSESKLPEIRRLSPTVVELKVPCKMHGDHVVRVVSDDDAAEVIAAFVAQYVFQHGYAGLYDLAADWDEIPF